MVGVQIRDKTNMKQFKFVEVEPSKILCTHSHRQLSHSLQYRHGAGKERDWQSVNTSVFVRKRAGLVEKALSSSFFQRSISKILE